MRTLPLTILLLAACGDSTGPSESGPPLGRYRVAYTYQYTGVFGGQFTGDGGGDFALTFASRDSIAGHSFGTNGEPYEPLKLGFWNVDAYAVWVVTQYQNFAGPTMRLRLNRDASTCTGRIVFLNESNYPLATCTITRVP